MLRPFHRSLDVFFWACVRFSHVTCSPTVCLWWRGSSYRREKTRSTGQGRPQVILFASPIYPLATLSLLFNRYDRTRQVAQRRGTHLAYWWDHCARSPVNVCSRRSWTETCRNTATRNKNIPTKWKHPEHTRAEQHMAKRGCFVVIFVLDVRGILLMICTSKLFQILRLSVQLIWFVRFYIFYNSYDDAAVRILMLIIGTPGLICTILLMTYSHCENQTSMFSRGVNRLKAKCSNANC